MCSYSSLEEPDQLKIASAGPESPPHKHVQPKHGSVFPIAFRRVQTACSLTYCKDVDMQLIPDIDFGCFYFRTFLNIIALPVLLVTPEDYMLHCITKVQDCRSKVT